MFRAIVVPVDLTDRNGPSVEMAAKLLATSGAGKIHLLHVIETIPGFSLEEEQDFYRRLQKAATEHLESLAAPLRQQGVQVEADVIYGTRARTIVEEATKLGADLVVIQSHRIDGERREFGTLSHQVALFARCPVLLVR
jgi:nucleotide-binding universal stress UspA family protein